jgi:hypothetical protein
MSQSEHLQARTENSASEDCSREPGPLSLSEASRRSRSHETIQGHPDSRAKVEERRHKPRAYGGE